MTEKAVGLISGNIGTISNADATSGSILPGGSISMAFSDGVVHITQDRTGDWTITAGLSVSSDRLMRLTKTLADLGFFQATEQAGIIYHLWTTALGEENDNRILAEETLLKVLKLFQDHEVSSYIA